MADAPVVAVDAIDSLRKDDDGRTRVILRTGDVDDDLVVSRRHVRRTGQEEVKLLQIHKALAIPVTRRTKWQDVRI